MKIFNDRLCFKFTYSKFLHFPLPVHSLNSMKRFRFIMVTKQHGLLPQERYNTKNCSRNNLCLLIFQTMVQFGYINTRDTHPIKGKKGKVPLLNSHTFFLFYHENGNSWQQRPLPACPHTSVYLILYVPSACSALSAHCVAIIHTVACRPVAK